MSHLIMGTAGHVDHGKTALIKALTGIECDTHNEEKRRGITINLGFAHMETGCGESIGIVDVPGHRDFIHTMVSGAGGINFVLLVIGADSGVMPQTREHLRIMQLLGIQRGLVALSRIDLLEDREFLELVRGDVAEFLKETFLQHAHVVEVSAKTGEGLEQLRETVIQVAAECDAGSSGENDIFRMFIDRVFSVSGFGTVVTGSVLSGSVTVKQHVYLLPGKWKKLQVRRLERHGIQVETIARGDRASINLPGLDKADSGKGMVIVGSDISLKETSMVDAYLELFRFFDSGALPKLGIWSQVIFLCGTFETQGRIHLLDRDTLLPNGIPGLVQIHLQEPTVLRKGDRFIIRNSSSDLTLGGGMVMDVSPLVHRKRKAAMIQRLSAIAHGKVPETVAPEVSKPQPVKHQAETEVSPHDIAFFAGYLKNNGLQVTTWTQLVDKAMEKKIPEQQLKRVMSHLIRAGNVFRIKNDYIHAGIVQNCKEKLLQWFEGDNKEISVAEFRDLIEGSRKTAMLLLTLFDSQLLTRRQGDVRTQIIK